MTTRTANPGSQAGTAKRRDRLSPVGGHGLMLAVGVVEIAAGILVAVRPRVGAPVVAAWLCFIILNLLAMGSYLDVALSCHVPPLFTEPGWNAHLPADVCVEAFQADRAARPDLPDRAAGRTICSPAGWVLS